MKHNFYTLALFSLSALLIFGSCSKDEITTEQENQITLNGHKLDISIQEEPFVAESPVSRSVQPAKVDTIDLGNDLYAEVSVEPDTEAPTHAQTRAAMSEGHYTIYAVNASGVRMPDQLSGTVQAGKFIPDHNQNIDLDQGTYTFVCHNDAVEDKGYSLEVKNGVDVPLIGVTTKTLTAARETISFVMKHQGARIRTQITSYTAYGDLKVKYTGNTYESGNAIYDVKGAYSTKAPMGDFTMVDDKPIQKEGNESFSAIVKPFIASSSYAYIAGGFHYATWNVVVSGTLHGKTINKTFTRTTNLDVNHTYLAKIALKTKDPLYLYQDGTVGYLGDKGTRTPIAVVSKEKTNTEEGTAVALKDASYMYAGIVHKDYVYGAWPPRGSRLFTQNNTSNYTTVAETLDDMDGYKWTWDAAGSIDGTIKANDDVNYNCFYGAGNYNPGVATQNIGKWYLPAAGEFNQFLKLFPGMVSFSSDAIGDDLKADFSDDSFGKLVNKCFTDAQGDRMFGGAGGAIIRYWMSSEVGTTNPLVYFSDKKVEIGKGAYRHNEYAYLRPFVHF